MVVLAGCQGLPPVDAPGDAAAASGLGDAIIVQMDDESLDASPAADRTLSPQQSVRLAIRRDARIQAALVGVRLALIDAKQARLLPNPILNVSWRFPEGGGTSIFETTITGDLMAVLTKPGQISAADSRLRAAAATAVATVLDVIAEVQESYASAQSIEAEVALIESRRVLIQRQRDVADARFKAGQGLMLDTLTLDAQRVALTVELSQRRLERTEQRLTLARLIGEPSGSADWQLDPWQVPVPVKANEAAWLKAALANRPEIRSRVWELAALGDEVALAEFAAFEGSDLGPHAEHDSSWVVGPDVTTPVPIFDFGQQHKAKAEALRLKARYELTQFRREVIEQVRRAYAAHAVSRAALEQAQNELLPLQEKRRDQAELAYRSGDADLATLLLAESDLQETRERLVELQEKVTVAMLKLERAVGGAGIARTVESPTTLPVTTGRE